MTPASGGAGRATALELGYLEAMTTATVCADREVHILLHDTICLRCVGQSLMHVWCLQFITHPGEEPHSYTASPKKPLSQELPGMCTFLANPNATNIPQQLHCNQSYHMWHALCGSYQLTPVMEYTARADGLLKATLNAAQGLDLGMQQPHRRKPCWAHLRANPRLQEACLTRSAQPHAPQRAATQRGLRVGLAGARATLGTRAPRAARPARRA